MTCIVSKLLQVMYCKYCNVYCKLSGKKILSEKKSGGGLDTSVGTFEFDLDPYVDRLSSRMGVRERHFKTQLRQRGNFIEQTNITQALQDGLR